jgi:hypothetical protein
MKDIDMKTGHSTMLTTQAIEKAQAGYKYAPLPGSSRVAINQLVVINEQGTATTTITALDHHGIVADVTFVRDDGWALGAPKIFEHIAYKIGKHRWIEFYSGKDTFPKPISEYVPV